MAEASSPTEVLRVAVTFPRPSDNLGPTHFGTALTSDAAPTFVPDPATVGKALDALERRGFTATTQGRLTASIRGTRKEFEDLFNTKLSTFTLDSDEQTKYSADSVLYPAADAPWDPPEGLMELIDDAYIQWPHIYMNQRFDANLPAPLPPPVNYPHLRVPGDVALLLNAARVHRAGGTGKGVKVAMIDSGFAHGHAYFQEMGYNSSVVLAPGATDKELDGNGHGTGESANIFAIAPDVTFIGIKLDNETNSNLSASVLEGFQEALSHNPQVISVSLGYDLTEPNTRRHLRALPNGLVALEAEIAQAVADGVVVVFSAGNGHVAFPGMMPDVISAGGVHINETGLMRASDYASAFSSKIYPGRLVPDFCGLVGLAANNADYILLPLQAQCEIDQGNANHDGTSPRDGWGVFSGTSAAAPQLAGVCALLLQKNPGLTPSEVKGILRRTCRDVIKGSANPASNQGRALRARLGSDSATGSGFVDVFAAWNQV